MLSQIVADDSFQGFFTALLVGFSGRFQESLSGHVIRWQTQRNQLVGLERLEPQGQGKGQGGPQPLLFGQAEVHHRPGRLDSIPGRPAPVHHFGDQEHGAYDHHDRVLAVPIRVEEGVVAHVGVAVQVVGQVEVGDEGIGLGEAPGDRVVVAGVVKVQPRLVQALPGGAIVGWKGAAALPLGAVGMVPALGHHLGPGFGQHYAGRAQACPERSEGWSPAGHYTTPPCFMATCVPQA